MAEHKHALEWDREKHPPIRESPDRQRGYERDTDPELGYGVTPRVRVEQDRADPQWASDDREGAGVGHADILPRVHVAGMDLSTIAAWIIPAGILGAIGLILAGVVLSALLGYVVQLGLVPLLT